MFEDKTVNKKNESCLWLNKEQKKKPEFDVDEILVVVGV